MPVSLTFGEGTLYAFLLVLARISGALVLAPMPGLQAGTETARIIAALAITISLLPSWPHFDAFPSGIATITLAVAGEAMFGLAIGLSVACLNELMKMGAQITAQQAGYGFASMIDPNTQADSGVLVIGAQLFAGLLFLALGLDREVIRAFAFSLAAHPPGLFHADLQLCRALFLFAADIFTIGVRLAFPAMALLLLVDISLALLGRINAQLHLIMIAFPIKMMIALALLGLLATMYPRVIASESVRMLQIAGHAAGLDSAGLQHGR
jgi:flagellar biosynthetic protein FliR